MKSPVHKSMILPLLSQTAFTRTKLAQLTGLTTSKVNSLFSETGTAQLTTVDLERFLFIIGFTKYLRSSDLQVKWERYPVCVHAKQELVADLRIVSEINPRTVKRLKETLYSEVQLLLIYGIKENEVFFYELERPSLQNEMLLPQIIDYLKENEVNHKIYHKGALHFIDEDNPLAIKSVEVCPVNDTEQNLLAAEVDEESWFSIKARYNDFEFASPVGHEFEKIKLNNLGDFKKELSKFQKQFHKIYNLMNFPGETKEISLTKVQIVHRLSSWVLNNELYHDQKVTLDAALKKFFRTKEKVVDPFTFYELLRGVTRKK
jgi:hypothetical protein